MSISHDLPWYAVLLKGPGVEDFWNRGLLFGGWDLDFFLDHYLGLVNICSLSLKDLCKLNSSEKQVFLNSGCEIVSSLSLMGINVSSPPSCSEAVAASSR